MHRGGRNDFGHWFAEPRDANRLLRGANLFEQSEALGFEFRDGHFLHDLSSSGHSIILWSILWS